MAQKGHHSNLSLLNMAWASSDEAVANIDAAAGAEQPPPNNKQSTIQIQVTAPDGTPSLTVTGTANGDNNANANGQAPAEEKKSKVTVPKLSESLALDTLRMFHTLGLGGADSQDLFGAVPKATEASPSQSDTQSQSQTQKQIFNMDQLAMNGMLPAVNEDNPVSPVLDTSHIMGNGMSDDALLYTPQTNVLQTGLQPQAIKGGAGKPKSDRNSPNSRNKNDALNELLQKNEARILNQFEQTGGAQHQKLTPRKEHDVKDMDEYKEVTAADLKQFEEMLSNTEKLIEDMIEICNYNGYGLNDHSHDHELNDNNNDEQDEIHFSQREEMKIKENALNNNITAYNMYVSEQLQQFNFNLSSNAIVDLMGVKPTMAFDTSFNRYADVVISHQGYVLYNNKRLTPHYFFNVLEERVQRSIDLKVFKIVRDVLRSHYFGMHTHTFPKYESLVGLSQHLIDNFENQHRVFYQFPGKIRSMMEDPRYQLFVHNCEEPAFQKQLTILQTHDPALQQDNYCVIVFPNHKDHLQAAEGVWSRSVTYFDNVVRGSMFQLIEHCTSMEVGNGWGMLLMNPNRRYIESVHFPTKEKYDQPPSFKGTETLTMPRNESSYAHTTELWKRFILPRIINVWKCKLLLISHCDGGNDIVHLLETQPNSHQHIIGIAMLDFYNWSLSEFSKKTRQVIEQKAAIYMSLYGSNESAYGLEPSAAKSPVTIFRTANKEKRYSPCYNMESVIRFFKSKIELNKIK